MQRLGIQSTLRAKKLLGALRDPSGIPRRMLDAGDRKVALRLMRLNTPLNRLVSRHTRELLRAYFKAGKLTTRIADRHVDDRFIQLSLEERTIYDAVEDYIATTYNQAMTSGVSAQKRSAIGFVMTIYRRRLASSFLALRKTLEGHLDAIRQPGGGDLLAGLTEGTDDDEGDEPDEDEAAKLAQEGLALEERSEIERLIVMIGRLPADSKCERLRQELAALRADGYHQAMVFTQFTDTMDFLRAELGRDTALRIMCFSGRGGEVANNDGTWRVISRDAVKTRFREGAADVLLCTDAAAEGLNFQFCGALINYDMPWNPMRVEQRIGRIDRLGQQYPDIRIVNLHYADTVETDVYVALRHRIGLFEKVVGGLQPILASMPRLISERVLTGRARDEGARQEAVRDIEAETDRARQGGGFDIDAVLDADLTEPSRPASPLTMDDLGRVISTASLLPPGLEAKPMSQGEYRIPATRHGARRARVDRPALLRTECGFGGVVEPRQSDISGTGGRGGSTARRDPDRDTLPCAVNRQPTDGQDVGSNGEHQEGGGRDRRPSRAIALVAERTHQPEQLGLVLCVMEGVVVAAAPRRQVLSDLARSSVGPGAARGAHVQRFDVQRGEAKRISAGKAMKIVVHKGPVEGRVEADKHQGAVVAGQGVRPGRERRHGSRRRLAPLSQVLKRQARDLQGLGVGVGVDRFKLDAERLGVIIHVTGADRQQAIFARDGSGCFHIHRDVDSGLPLMRLGAPPEREAAGSGSPSNGHEMRDGGPRLSLWWTSAARTTL